MTQRIRRQIPEGGRQERLPGGRHRVIQVRVSEDEYEALEARAAATKVSMPRYLVMAVLIDSRMTVNERRAWTAETFRLERVMYGLAEQLEELVDLGPLPEWLMGRVVEATESVRQGGLGIHEAVVNAMLALVDVPQRSKEARRILEILKEQDAVYRRLWPQIPTTMTTTPSSEA